MWRQLRYFASHSLNNRCLAATKSEKYKVRDRGAEMVLQLWDTLREIDPEAATEFVRL